MTTEWDGSGLPPIQELINTGMAWQLEGHVGRQCMEAIECGAAMLGIHGYRDYYGNYVPSRFEVEQGTKGSPDFHAAWLADQP